ncbi:mediator of RNA polymerase II transcription subunit 31 [Aspergillus bombycis]|uniref:Mediator of RNA polymerase II transcription subunit 31 n=1 Tax=Aspergillus bombycis TaxID=109264 RepID=A0A1F7ZYI3_9EURO|nr:mediator of RNA polymerase II transcription subunit 31 [Aspergillus bombycis]OGM44523.1 mediator of RNA polymerase II transcription subunit 31 [Aspergillus bombycis]
MDQPQPPTGQPEQPPPTLTNPLTYPHLLGISNASDEGDATKDTADPDAQAFAAYLAYLYSYWKTPDYAQFLTHPGATLRALRLLQEDRFRRDIIRPQVIEGLAGTNINEAGGATIEQEGEQDKEEQGKQDEAGNNNSSKT